jgi:hypothetical protein
MTFIMWSIHLLCFTFGIFSATPSLPTPIPPPPLVLDLVGVKEKNDVPLASLRGEIHIRAFHFHAHCENSARILRNTKANLLA